MLSSRRHGKDQTARRSGLLKFSVVVLCNRNNDLPAFSDRSGKISEINVRLLDA